MGDVSHQDPQDSAFPPHLNSAGSTKDWCGEPSRAWHPRKSVPRVPPHCPQAVPRVSLESHRHSPAPSFPRAAPRDTGCQQTPRRRAKRGFRLPEGLLTPATKLSSVPTVSPPPRYRARCSVQHPPPGIPAVGSACRCPPLRSSPGTGASRYPPVPPVFPGAAHPGAGGSHLRGAASGRAAAAAGPARERGEGRGAALRLDINNICARRDISLPRQPHSPLPP